MEIELSDSRDRPVCTPVACRRPDGTRRHTGTGKEAFARRSIGRYSTVMVLLPATPHPGMDQYGIKIPITGSNAQKTVDALLDDAELAASRDRWLLVEETPPVSREQLELTHDPAFVGRLLGDGADKEVIRTFELKNPDGTYHRYDPADASRPLSDLVTRGLMNAGGTLRAARIALEKNFCFYLGGGMHHAMYDYGEGFCLVNDVVIAARVLQAEGNIKTAWIVDVDAHKGDGTAALTADDKTIQTLSIHMAAGWPLDQPRELTDGRKNPSYTPSDIDIPIAEGEEGEYLLRLRIGLEKLKRFGIPDLAIVLAGADPWEGDRLPSAEPLKLSLNQMLQRDMLVERFLADLEVPAAFVTAGNYGDQSWKVYCQFLDRFIRRRGAIRTDA